MLDVRALAVAILFLPCCACGGPSATSTSETAGGESAPESSGSNAWRSCEPESGRILRLRCGPLEISIARGRVVQGRALLDVTLATLDARDAAHGELTSASGAAFPYASFEHDGSVTEISAPRADLLVSCTHGTPTACHERFQWIADHGIPPTVAFPTPTMSVAGAAIEIPAGCELGVDEQVRCGSVTLGWRDEVASEDPFEGLTSLYASLGFQVERQREIACRIGDVSGDGLDLSLSREGVTSAVVLCSVPYAAAFSIVECTGFDVAAGSTAPTPCDQVLTVVSTE